MNNELYNQEISPSILTKEEKQKAYQKAYRERNKEKAKEYHKNWSALNKTKRRKHQNKYRKSENNKEKIKARERANNEQRKQERSRNRIPKSQTNKTADEKKELRRDRRRAYYYKNKERLYLIQKESRRKNPENQKAHQKAFWEKNPEKRKEYKRKERLTVHDKLRRAVHNAFARIKKDKPTNTLELLGCTWEEAKAHIERLWQEGMTWENHGTYGWHIDHIRPVSSFGENELHLMNRIENLQPLWWQDNLSKSDKY